MKVLIYLSHPAQFLFYKNAVDELRKENHQVAILIKSKDILSGLLDAHGWDYYNIMPSPRGDSKLAIFWSLIRRDIRLFRFALKNKPDLLMGTDASLAHVGLLMRIPCITTLEDDFGVIKKLAYLTYPFTSNILVPQVCDVGKWQAKKTAYSGYMKLAYLHPKRFTPQKDNLKIDAESPYFLIRLSGLNAHHDFGMKGIDDKLLDKTILQLERKGRVYISSENSLRSKYDRYKLNIPLKDMHHYLFYANMLICDSQSMAVEAAMLGTPSLRFSDFAGKISVLEELENKFELTFGIKTSKPEKLFKKIEELLSTPDLREVFQHRRKKMLAEKIDVTAFLVWYIKEFPRSMKILKENPDYQVLDQRKWTPVNKQKINIACPTSPQTLI